MDLPKVLKLRVQVEVAHSRLRIVSMLVTCLPLDASPEKEMFHHLLWCVQQVKNATFTTRVTRATSARETRQERRPTEEDLIVSWVGEEVLAVFRPVQMGDKAGVSLRKREEFMLLEWRFHPKHTILDWQLTFLNQNVYVLLKLWIWKKSFDVLDIHVIKERNFEKKWNNFNNKQTIRLFFST